MSRVEELIERLNTGTNRDKRTAAFFLRDYSKDPRILLPLVKSLQNEDEDVWSQSAITLGSTQDKRALDPLLNMLNDKNEKKRSIAAEALGELGYMEAEEALIERLLDKDYLVCINAAEALKKIGSKKSFSAIIDLLKNEDSEIREQTSELLGIIGDRRAIDLLISLLREDEEFGVRAKSAEALGKIGDAKAAEALVKALNDEHSFVRGFVAGALGEIGDKSAIPALEKLLKIDSDNETVIAEAITNLQGKKEGNIESLMNLLKSENSHLRKEAVEALGEIGNLKTTNLLIMALKDKNAIVRRAAMIGLRCKSTRKLKEYNVNFSVFTELLKDKDKIVRETAAHILGEIGGEAAVESLISELQSGKGRIKKKISAPILGALGNIGNFKTLPYLLHGIKSKDSNVRAEVAQGIGNVLKYNNLFKVLNQILRDKDNFIQEIKSLLDIFNLSIQALIELLSDSVDDVVFEAVCALGDMKAKESFSYLVKILEDRDTASLKTQTIIALEELEDARAIPILRNLTSTKNDEIREYATMALFRLSQLFTFDQETISALKNLSNDSDRNVRQWANYALGWSDSGILNSRYLRKTLC